MNGEPESAAPPNTHGGARPGAGRPSGATVEKKRKSKSRAIIAKRLTAASEKNLVNSFGDEWKMDDEEYEAISGSITEVLEELDFLAFDNCFVGLVFNYLMYIFSRTTPVAIWRGLKRRWIEAKAREEEAKRKAAAAAADEEETNVDASPAG